MFAAAVPLILAAVMACNVVEAIECYDCERRDYVDDVAGFRYKGDRDCSETDYTPTTYNCSGAEYCLKYSDEVVELGIHVTRWLRECDVDGLCTGSGFSSYPVGEFQVSMWCCDEDLCNRSSHQTPTIFARLFAIGLICVLV